MRLWPHSSTDRESLANGGQQGQKGKTEQSIPLSPATGGQIPLLAQN